MPDAVEGARVRLLPMVVVVGVGGALIGAAYVSAMRLLATYLWPAPSVSNPALKASHPQHWSNAQHLVVLALVGLAVGGLIRLLGNPGDVELLVNNIHLLGGPDETKELRSLIPVSLLCITAGGAMGPEAPLVQTTGTWGSWLAWRFHRDRDEVRILTITGMAAGFTVLFGAPFGSAVFALEILHRRGLQYYEALLPAVVGALSGYAVYASLTHAGLEPLWHFPPGPQALRPIDMAWAAGAGVAGAGVAVLFTLLTKFLRWVARPIPAGVLPLAGGLILGGLAFWSPYALTFGEFQVNPLVVRTGVTVTFLAAALAKLIGTSVTLSTGWRGGFIIPLLFIGAALGRATHALVPSSNEVLLMAALMAAINVGVTKTALGTTLIVTEMCGLHLLPTTLLAAVIGLLLTSEVSLIHTQQEREAVGGTPRHVLRGDEEDRSRDGRHSEP